MYEKHTRRSFLRLSGVSGAGLLLYPNSMAQAVHSSNKSRPNILWILSEDMCPDLGCYGTAQVETPNLDKLAAQGIRFTNAFTASPVCSASRSAMITGMYQTTLGAHLHRSQRTKGTNAGEKKYHDSYRLPEPVEPVTEYFRRAGYYTVNVRNVAPDAQGSGKEDFNFELHNKAFDGDDWSRRQPGQPFFAQMSIKQTHRGKHWEEIPQHVKNRVDPAKVSMPPYYPDHPIARQDWADYLDSIQWMDTIVGKVLERLEAEHPDRNTVVVFIGDHGRCHVRGKQWLYDAGIHIPLIVRWPDQIKPQVRDDLVSAIDIPVTLLKLAGIEPPGHMQGQDFLKGKKREYIYAARDRCDETVEIIRCVRTKEYKYIRNYTWYVPYMQPNRYKDTSYPMRNLLRQLHAEGKLNAVQEQFMAPQKPVEELYNVVDDPHEVHDLAGSPENEKILNRLRNAHKQWLVETGDLGLIPEPELEDLGVKYGNKYSILQQKENANLIKEISETIEQANRGTASTEIITALDSGEVSVRYWAATGLGNLVNPPKSAVDALEKALQDKSASVRIAAAKGLVRMNKTAGAVPVLLKELNSPNHAARHHAALVLEDLTQRIKKNLEDERYDYVNRVMERIFSDK